MYRAAVVLMVVFMFASPAFAEDKSVLAVFDLGEVVETPPGEDLLLFGSSNRESLKDLAARIRRTARDEAIDGVVLLTDGLSAGSVQVEELRQAISSIRKQDKDVHVHATTLSTKTLALVSEASQICVVPTGDVWITGLYGESIYVRGLLDKVGVQPEYLTCGEFKSAAEMFMRNGPSKQALANKNRLFDGMFSAYVKMIAAGRDVEEKQARAWIDHGVYTADAAQRAGVIDAVKSRSEFVADLKSKYGQKLVFEKSYGKKKAGEVDLSSPLGLFKLYSDLLSAGGSKQAKSGRPAIAIVYVDGPIMTGSPGSNPLALTPMGGAFSSPIRDALLDAAEDDSVKAVVLRVDSPGGSATASEIILNAAKEVRKKKPLIVSMGNVAGSGGYYVACASDTIFAGETTLTGSIGVVGGKFSTTKAFDKVGVHFHAIKRGKNADLFNSGDALTDAQREKMQGWMDEIYEVFKGHVVKIRGDKLTKDIEKLAGGRVFTGRQALEVGLVDKIGSLRDALAFAAEEAGAGRFEVRVMPRSKGMFESLLGTPTDNPNRLSVNQPARLALPQASLWEAALPQLDKLAPRRALAVRQVLQQLMILQQDGVALTMPIVAMP